MKKHCVLLFGLVFIIILSCVIVTWPFVYVYSPFCKYALDVKFSDFSKDVYSISEFEEKEGTLKDYFTQLSGDDLKNINNSNDFVVAKLNIKVVNNNDFDVTYMKFKRIVSIEYKKEEILFWHNQNWLLNDGFPIETQLMPGDYYFSEVWIILLKEDFYNLIKNIEDTKIIMEAEGTKVVWENNS